MPATDPATVEAIDSAVFTDALALAANGVSIVTTSGAAERAGLTVSSVCSVCAEPPLILACVNADNDFCRQADRNGIFAINLLASGHADLSNRFAGLVEPADADRFLAGDWQSLTTGAPILSDALVGLDCVIESSTVHGTHHIYIGRVVDILANRGNPLVYSMRGYASLAPLPLDSVATDRP